MQHILYSVQTRTNPGKVRKNNEDAYGSVLDWREKLHLTDEILQQRGHLFAVADGMGGHAAGEVASQLAIETLFTEYYTGEWVDPKTTMAAAIATANRVIFERAEADARLSGMGTTLVAALYQPDYGLVANVGDSRAYLFRSGKIFQVTRDHSWVTEQLNNGILTEEEAAHHPFRNVITRALGNEAQVEPEFFELPPLPEDILLLCSDGLSNQISEQEIANILGAYPLDEAADMLVKRVLERGAPDNVTLILVQMQGGNAQRRSASLLPWLALMAAILIIGGFVLWNFLPRASAPLATQTPGAVAIGTFTPVPTPEKLLEPATPAPSPTASATAPATPTLPAPVGNFTSEEAIIYAPPSEQDNRPLVFVSGEAAVQAIAENDAWITVTIAADGNHFSADVIGVQSPVVGGQLALVGYVLPSETDGNNYSLKPMLLLAPFGDSGMFSVEWQAHDNTLQTFEERFDIHIERQPIPDMNVIKLSQ